MCRSRCRYWKNDELMPPTKLKTLRTADLLALRIHAHAVLLTAKHKFGMQTEGCPCVELARPGVVIAQLLASSEP